MPRRTASSRPTASSSCSCSSRRRCGRSSSRRWRGRAPRVTWAPSRWAGRRRSRVLALPALVLGIVRARTGSAGLLTGSLPEPAQQTAADALPWMLVAAVAHLYAALAASVLARFDDYGTAAVGYALGSAARPRVHPLARRRGRDRGGRVGDGAERLDRLARPGRRRGRPPRRQATSVTCCARRPRAGGAAARAVARGDAPAGAAGALRRLRPRSRRSRGRARSRASATRT